MFEIPVESEKAREKFINEINDKVTLHNDSWPDINLLTTDDTLDRYLKEDVPSEQDLVFLYYVNENNVETCPQIQILIGNQPCRVLIDTGCQCSIISKELYNKFKARGLYSLELPTQNVVLKSAFTGRTKRVRRQALVKLKINNFSLDQIILISPQLVTPLLLGMDFCMDNHVVIDFPKKKIIINADDKESATELDLVNEGRNIGSSIDSPVTRVINLGTAELPPTPQLDRILNPSISDPPTPLYNVRLPEEDLCPNQMTYEGTTFCSEVSGLFSWNDEVTNGGKAKRVNTPNEYMNINSAVAEGKNDDTDANVIRNVKVRNLILENEGRIGRNGTFQGRSNVGITGSYDVEGLDKGEEDSSLSLERLRIEENLSCEEKCKLLKLIRKY
jgi:predicted aspartyl protease